MSTPSKQSLSSQTSSDARDDLSGESASQLRRDIEQTRESMSSTLSAIEQKLTPQYVVAQAKEVLAANAQQLATAASQRARVLGADAQAQANQLALALRDQGEHRTQQLRRWYDDMSAQYPWFPAAVLGGALALSALAVWRLNARRG